MTSIQSEELLPPQQLCKCTMNIVLWEGGGFGSQNLSYNSTPVLLLITCNMI